MSSSTVSSPTSASHNYQNRDRRVSFDLGKKPKTSSFFSQLAASTAATQASQDKSRHSHHRSHYGHSHCNTHKNGSYTDHRTRVEDASDEDDGNVGSSSKRKTSKSTAAKIVGTAPVLQPGLPITTASAAAAGYSGGNGGLQQPYKIQVNPAFIPGMAQGFPFPAGMTHTINGVDPTAITGLSFLPVVPDTTNGPMLHTYIPRSDPPGGVVYVQQQQQHPMPGYPTAGIPLSSYPIASTTAPMLPMMNQQPGVSQPIYVQQQPLQTYAFGGGSFGSGGGPPVVMMPGMSMPGGQGGGFGGGGMVHPEPALGIGQTPSEVLQEQLEFAYANNMYEPQDFKPADDDKSRFYWVRELDGNWTQRSRATIDHIGCRWYITDSGVFYAVRLAD